MPTGPANLGECVRCLCVCVPLCSAWTQSVLSGLMSALAQSGFPYISANCLQTLQQQRKCGDNGGLYSIRSCKGSNVQTWESVWFIKERINLELWGLQKLVVIQEFTLNAQMHSGLNVGRKEILESVLLPLSRSISQEIVELMMALVQNLVSCMCVGCVLKHSWSKGCFSLSNSIPYYISKSSVKKSIQDHYEM